MGKFEPFATTKADKYKLLCRSGMPILDVIDTFMKEFFDNYLKSFPFGGSALVTTFKKSDVFARQIAANSDGVVNAEMRLSGDWFKSILALILLKDAQVSGMDLVPFQAEMNRMYTQLGWGDYRVFLAQLDSAHKSPIEDLIPYPWVTKDGKESHLLLRLIPTKEYITGMQFESKAGAKYTLLYQTGEDIYEFISHETGKCFVWPESIVSRMKRVGWSHLSGIKFFKGDAAWQKPPQETTQHG